jgi:hypothetical protein
MCSGDVSVICGTKFVPSGPRIHRDDDCECYMRDMSSGNVFNWRNKCVYKLCSRNVSEILRTDFVF